MAETTCVRGRGQRCQPLFASLISRSVRQGYDCRSTAAVPRCSACEGEDFIMKLDFRQRLLASTLLATAGLIANPAYAQDSSQSTVPDQNQATNPGAAPPAGPVESNPTPTTSAEGEPVQRAQDIIVTGTRIPQPNLESAAPVTVVSMQDIKLSGTTRIDDALNQLPSASA